MSDKEQSRRVLKNLLPREIANKVRAESSVALVLALWNEDPQLLESMFLELAPDVRAAIEWRINNPKSTPYRIPYSQAAILRLHTLCRQRVGTQIIANDGTAYSLSDIRISIIAERDGEPVELDIDQLI